MVKSSNNNSNIILFLTQNAQVVGLGRLGEGGGMECGVATLQATTILQGNRIIRHSRSSNRERAQHSIDYQLLIIENFVYKKGTGQYGYVLTK